MTSKLAGIGKKTAWKIFQSHAKLLLGLGTSVDMCDSDLADTETYVCKLYDQHTLSKSINEVRASLFRSYKSNIDKLPPTKDALHQHIKQANYQAHIWKQSLVTVMDIPPPPNGHGWKQTESSIELVLMTQEAIPSNYIELASCGCTPSGFHCRTNHCMCKKNDLKCTNGCQCTDVCENLCNES